MSTVHMHATDAGAALTLEKLLTEVDSVKPGHVWYVEPGEPFYKPPTNRQVKRASELKSSVDVLRDELTADIRREHFFADIYRLDGSRVPLEERDEQWWAAVEAHENPGCPNGILNSVVRLGTDYLAVGRGEWAILGETTVDGEVAFEFEPYDEYFARTVRAERAAKDAEEHAYLNAHPVIEASKPVWATGIIIDVDDEVTTAFYEARFGPIDVQAIGKYKDGELTLSAPSYGLTCELAEVDSVRVESFIAEARKGLADARAAVEVNL